MFDRYRWNVHLHIGTIGAVQVQSHMELLEHARKGWDDI
jgi:hypothetical protein